MLVPEKYTAWISRAHHASDRRPDAPAHDRFFPHHRLRQSLHPCVHSPGTRPLRQRVALPTRAVLPQSTGRYGYLPKSGWDTSHARSPVLPALPLHSLFPRRVGTNATNILLRSSCTPRCRPAWIVTDMAEADASSCRALGSRHTTGVAPASVVRTDARTIRLCRSGTGLSPPPPVLPFSLPMPDHIPTAEVYPRRRLNRPVRKLFYDSFTVLMRLACRNIFLPTKSNCTPFAACPSTGVAALFNT